MSKLKNRQESFICFNCEQENFYNPSEYTDEKRGNKELLMEALIFKEKEVLIVCKNEKCKERNAVIITYI